MIRRNISLILVIIAMSLNTLNFDFSNFNIESAKTWLFLAASLLIIASITLLVINENELLASKKMNGIAASGA